MFDSGTYGLKSGNFKAMRTNLAIIFMFPFTKGHSVYLKAIKSKPEAGIQTYTPTSAHHHPLPRYFIIFVCEYLLSSGPKIGVE